MDGHQTQKLTNGHLPLTAFRHSEPTAVGIVDLERSLTPRAPDGRALNSGQRDNLLLIRLHDEPIAIAYIDRPLGAGSNEDLAVAIWQSTEGEIKRHIERFDCTRVPNGPAELVNERLSPTETCSGALPAKQAMSLAVIVPTLGREQQLKRCLTSLLAQRTADFELIVVDNRPTTGIALRVANALAAVDRRVRYVAEPRAGSSIARNRGVAETDADLVAFTDDDVVLDPSWLEWLVAPFAEKGVTATCGMVLPLELDTEAQKRFERYGGFSKGVERRTYDLRSGRDAGLPLYPFLGDIFGSGNSMAFRRTDFVAAGGFDPALGGGSPAQSGEDIYAFSTVILRGGRLVYEPRAVCWHEHRKDTEALHQQVFDYGVGLGAIITKAMLSGDSRFFATAARSLPTVLGLLRRKQSSSDVDTSEDNAFTKDLVRTQYAGMLRGPMRYATGTVRARKLGFGDVIRGG